MSLPSAKKLLLVAKGLFKASGTWIYSLNDWVSAGNPFTFTAEGIRVSDNVILRRTISSKVASPTRLKLTLQIRAMPGNGASGHFYYKRPGEFQVEFGTYRILYDENNPTPGFVTFEATSPAMTFPDVEISIVANNQATFRNWSIVQSR